jgi:hypothetical protein
MSKVLRDTPQKGGPNTRRRFNGAMQSCSNENQHVRRGIVIRSCSCSTLTAGSTRRHPSRR